MHIPSSLFRVVLFGLFLIATGCMTTSTQNDSANGNAVDNTNWGEFQVDDFYLNTNTFTGWEYGQSSQPYTIPVITLASSNQISLKFDYLGTDAKQFKANIIHYTPEWQPSNVPRGRYLDGVFEDYFGSGRSSVNTNLSYRRYEYSFPVDQQRPIVSGNYMLEIRDYDTNNLVARLPFMISEDVGELSTRTQTLYNIGPNGEPRYQPFSRYTYPEFVEMPRLDLKYHYLPIPFWGKQQPVSIVDYLDEGEARYHLSREESFSATLIRTVNLQNPRPTGTQIDEVQTPSGAQPVQVLLDPDEVNLESPQTLPIPTLFGNRKSSQSAQVLDVTFQLLNPDESTNQKVYLVGNFNGWKVMEQPMQFNPGTGYWEQTIRIPEGHYQYQYMRKVNGKLEPLAGAFSYADVSPPYTTQVYYRDPDLYLYRLLNVGVNR